MISYGRQEITDADESMVIEALRSDFLTQGPRIQAFENMFSSYCSARHAVTVSNATAALHAAYAALEVGASDLVWTSPITFVATANAARYLGADVDFVDIDERTCNISVEALKEKLRIAERNGRLPKVVAPVHFAGQSCDMAAIAELGQKYGFNIVEDASHAVGGRYHDEPIGNCRYSDICVFSFHPVKIITTGEGGLATTNDDELKVRMDLFRSHGITRDQALMEEKPDGPWYYEMGSIGFNYRMTDLQAALGLSQLTRVDAYVQRRHEIAALYDEAFKDTPLGRLEQTPSAYSSYHLYVIRWKNGTAGKSRREAFEELRAAGIGVNVHYIPVHLQPYYKAQGFGPSQFPVAEAYYEEAITLPLHPRLTDDEISQIVRAVLTCCTQEKR